MIKSLPDDIVLGDGGSIFEMERRGYIQAGPFTPEVVLEHPEAVLQMHRDFARCGSQMIQALSFYGSEDKSSRWKELNSEAVRLARRAAGPQRLVAGGLSPTPSFRQGVRGPRLEEIMRNQLTPQLEAGVDLVIGETFLWMEEALTALVVAKSMGCFVILTMNVGPEGSRDGLSPGQCARELVSRGADVVGVNCSWGPTVALQVALEMAKAVDRPVACQPIGYESAEKAGPFESWPEFPLSLEKHQLSRRRFARFAREAADSGITLIGGCCGVGPAHIRAMAEVLGRSTEGSDKSPDMSKHMIPEVRERHRSKNPSAS
jgi:methionine synthase I (cobalamin-dependent)